MRDKITVRALEKWSREARSKGAQLYVWDTELRGFGAYFSPKSSNVSWVFQVWSGGRGGKAKRITLGRYPDLDLDEARKQAINQRKYFNDGVALISPSATRLLNEREAQNLLPLSEAIEQFLKRNSKPGRYWVEVRRQLTRDLLNVLGEQTKLPEISKTMMRDLIDARQDTHPGAARTLYAALRPFFNWCVERDLIAVSPLSGVSAPKPIKARDRVLTDAELKSIWLALTTLGWPWGPYHRVLMLTAQRREETAQMRWSELDLGKGEWSIPKERTKNGKEHLVHLSPQCIAVLGEIPRKNSDVVFTLDGTSTIYAYKDAKDKIDALVDGLVGGRQPMKPWRVHDFRRTAASGMAALGHQPHVIERVLNHISGAQGGLVSVYQRHQYVKERKLALLDWGNYLLRAVE